MEIGIPFHINLKGGDIRPIFISNGTTGNGIPNNATIIILCATSELSDCKVCCSLTDSQTGWVKTTFSEKDNCQFFNLAINLYTNEGDPYICMNMDVNVRFILCRKINNITKIINKTVKKIAISTPALQLPDSEIYTAIYNYDEKDRFSMFM